MSGEKIKMFLEQSMKYALGTFYVFALGVFLFLVFYWVVDKETFYFLDENIHIATNTSYVIDVVGKSTEKSSSDLTWSSTNPDIISVDDEGNVMALQQGIVTIEAKSKLGLVKQSIKVSASDFIIYSIVFDNDRMVISKNEEVTLNPILNGEKNIRSSLTWTSSNPSVAEVTSDGVVKGKLEGSTYITAIDEYSGHSAKVRVDVSGGINVEIEETDKVNDGGDNYESDEYTSDVNVISITMNSPNLSLNIGQESLLKVTMQPSNATNKGVVWKSTNEAVAVVDKNGKVTAKGEGECIIYATSLDGSKSTFSAVTVRNKEIPITSISFSNKSSIMHVGERLTLIPRINPSTATNQKLVWRSSNSDIATVDSNGIVSAKKVGVVEITAETNNHQMAKVKITIEDAPTKMVYMKSIQLHYSYSYLELGSSYSLKPTYQPQNATNSNLIFKSSEEEVITITADGVMTAKKPGFSIITVSSQDGGASSSILIFVPSTPIPVENIVFSSGAKQIEIGETYVISYSLIPTNANNTKMVWTSSNSDIASVDRSGKVTGKKSGTVTITASMPETEIKASFQVAVVPANKVIPLSKQNLKVYKNDIVLLESKKGYSRAMQNFAIENFGTNNEIFYFSYPTLSNTSVKNISNAMKSSLVRTVVQRIPKNKLSSKTGEQNSYMFLNNTGHAQSFEFVNGEMWLNGDGYVAESDGAYWGYYRSLIRTNFKANKPTDKFQEKQNVKFNSSNGASYGNPEVGIDEGTDMLAIRSGNKVLIYQLSELKKGNLVLLYQFTLSNKIDGGYYDRQGHDIANGYYYQYRGQLGSSLYIEVYNMLGELIYTRKVKVSLNKPEAEGLKIYNNQLFIGVTYESGKNGRYNSIYYFG